MNKSKQPVAKTLRKKIQKEIKKGVRGKDTSLQGPLGEAISWQKLQRKTPPFEPILAHKKELKKKKVSKRTSPKEKIINSIPAHTRKEGERWEKHLIQKEQLKNKKIKNYRK